MSDSLTIFSQSYSGVTGFKATDTNQNTLTYIRPQGTKSISANGTGIDVSEYAAVDVTVPAPSPSLQTKTKSYTPSETAQSETVSADVGYDGIGEIQISVGAVSSSYVGSGITRRSSSDLTASGNTVSAPAGYYESSASKSVASGTEGTPSATKGTVSNHSVSVTPSVTNSAGYISGGTHTGTAVTVTASELESGTKSISANGTNIDVTGYAAVDVAVPTGSSKAIYTYTGLASRTANSYGSTNATVTVSKAGTYTISYVAVRGSSSGTMGTNLHIGNTSGTNNTTWNNGTYGQSVTLTGQTISANTAVTIYATSGNTSRTIYVGQLVVKEE